MENKNIVLLRHHIMGVKYTNTFYKNQLENIEDYVIVDCTSRCVRNKEFMKEHPTFAKDLSPFFIGPVVGEDGVNCNKFETYWQCSKVYPCFVDKNKELKKDEWLKWRNRFFTSDKLTKDELRHPSHSLGYKEYECVYSAIYNKETKDYDYLDYITARKKVYFKEYSKLVYNTPSFKWLKGLVDSGKKVAIVDFDAFNYYSDFAKEKRYESYVNKCKNNKIQPSLTLDDLKHINTMKDVVNFTLPCGHGVVLKALLQEDIVVDENNNVIDKTGILD